MKTMDERKSAAALPILLGMNPAVYRVDDDVRLEDGAEPLPWLSPPSVTTDAAVPSS